MEHTKVETRIVEQAILEAADTQLRDLNDLQLALVGGGNGEVSPY